MSLEKILKEQDEAFECVSSKYGFNPHKQPWMGEWG